MIKERAIICDIDGCVLDTSRIDNEIVELGLTQEQSFKYFDINISRITPIVNIKVCHFLYYFASNEKCKIIFVTARSEKLREITYKQLAHVMEVRPEIIYMRPYGNYDEPHLLKEKILLKIKEHFNIFLAIDDNIQTCNMYEKHGIITIMCNIQKSLENSGKKE